MHKIYYLVEEVGNQNNHPLDDVSYMSCSLQRQPSSMQWQGEHLPRSDPIHPLQETPGLLCPLLFSLVELVFLYRHNSIDFLPDVLLQCEALGMQVHLV